MRRSVAVSPSPAGARPPMRASSARALAAHSGRTYLLEDPECLLKGPPRGRPLLRPPLDLALREQRAAKLERLRDLAVLVEGALEHERRRGRIAIRREQQPPASRGRGKRPARPLPRHVLELSEQRGGGVKVSHADLRLDRVGVNRDDARLLDAHLSQEPNHGIEMLAGLDEAPQR